MENNNAAQRSTHNAQRNDYPSRGGQRTWHGERQHGEEKPKQVYGKQGAEAFGASAQDSSQKPFKTFRDLGIWQKGISLVKAVYQKSSAFPKDELYGLVAQMRRAAVSIPSNIAEGYRRRHAKEFQQFLNVALGSIGELETQIIISGDLGFLSEENKNHLLEELDHLVRMTVSLCNKVQR